MSVVQIIFAFVTIPQYIDSILNEHNDFITILNITSFMLFIKLRRSCILWITERARFGWLVGPVMPVLSLCPSTINH